MGPIRITSYNVCYTKLLRVRFSLSRYTREREIDYVIEKLPPVIERLRSLSPYWVQNKPQLAELGEFAPAYG